jgi:hypothetical protein
MQYNINLQALAAEAFGYAPLVRYSIPEQPEPETLRQTPSGTPLPPDMEGTGLLGLPVFARVEFLAAAGWRQLVLDDPIVEVSRDKLIVTTDIQGRNGSVKEYISNGDYAVTIKGVLASNPKDGRFARRYPAREVAALQSLLDVPAALPVTGRLFRLLGIKNLVIKGHSWPALPGFTNLQAYELRCLSDDPIELNLNESRVDIPAFRPNNV